MVAPLLPPLNPQDNPMQPFKIITGNLIELSINDRVTIGTFAHRHPGTVIESQIYRRTQLVTVWPDASEPGTTKVGSSPPVQHFHQNRLGTFIRVTQAPSGAWLQYHNTRLIF